MLEEMMMRDVRGQLNPIASVGTTRSGGHGW
jgi:hypothetical protein